MSIGIENLKRSAALRAISAVEDALDPSHVRGDSPIEQLLFAALQTRIWIGASEYRDLHIVKTNDEETAAKVDPRFVNDPTLIMRPQAQLEGWRVDFLIHAFDYARHGGRQRWRGLIVECDGHDFHERTKKQAERDRSRDREFQLRKFGVLRFTGSEIVKDPWACAAQITDWAVEGFP